MEKATGGAKSIMTIEDAAAYMGLSPVTVRRLAREGKIPAFKVGRQWRIKRELLDRYLADMNQEIDEAWADG